MKYKEIKRMFGAAGWELIRQQGSHQVWRRGTEVEVIAGKDSDDVPKGLLNHFLKRLGLK
jgi:predicted RNA binding protein YcfA (HicA-like mRNA interferase family)